MNMIQERENFNYDSLYKTSLNATIAQEIGVILRGLVDPRVIKRYLVANNWADKEAMNVLEALPELQENKPVRILFIGGGAVPYSVFYLVSRLKHHPTKLDKVTIVDKSLISAMLGSWFLTKFLPEFNFFNYRGILGQEIDWQSELKEGYLNLVFIAAHVVGKSQILAKLSGISLSSPLIVLRNPDYDLSDKRLGSCRLDPQELKAFATKWEIEKLPRLPGVSHQVLIFRRK